MLAAFGRMFGLDPRSPQEVEGDIADEFSFHLQMLEEELVRDGETPERARQIASERFGDQEKFARECREIAFKEQRMAQKIQIGLIVFLTLALGASFLVSYQFVRAQREMGAAMRAEADALRAQLEAMRAQAAQATAQAEEATRRLNQAEKAAK